VLVQRIVPADLRYKGNRKRRAVRTAPSAPRGARSLDSVNHLATTDLETFDSWRKRHETAQDRHRKLYSIHDRLLKSLQSAAHVETYIRQEAASEAATGSAMGWQKEKARGGRNKWSAWKDFERVAACQTEWKGFKSTCCGGRAVAVPIGCNHRLCPLCNAHRAEHYRERVKSLFDHLANPQLLTLTVPNCKRLTRETISTLRKRLRAFLKDHKGFLLGGVYSIEITRNRQEGTWHPHIHALVDVAGSPERLPYWQFMERKWRLEFAWFVLTQGRKAGRRVWTDSDFEEWVSALDPRRGGCSSARPGERRSVDLRPVSTDKKAAYEVMKYMTKVAFFVDDTFALAEFLRAVKGVRAIQTFGSCYGFKVEDAPVESKLSCECGENKFESIGLLGLGMVKMDPDGRWFVRDDAPVHGRRCRGGTTEGRLAC
jgi:hypothetical protein